MERILVIEDDDAIVMTLLALGSGNGQHRDQVVSRDDLLDAVWDDISVAPRTIEPHIVYLRKKLERIPAQPARILSVRGVGYRFRG